MSVPDYELIYNLQEIKRFVKEAKQVIVYYKTVTDPDNDTELKEKYFNEGEMMSEETKTEKLPADVNGDGKVDDEEKAMYLEFKRKEREDQDAMRDSQRKMAWFALRDALISFCCCLCLTCRFGSSAENIR